jgi:hypothetical protein
MVILQQLSIQLQSLLYSILANGIRPYTINVAALDTIMNTEVVILVDMSASMTSLSSRKLICVEILAVGLTVVLLSFWVPTTHFACVNREAI